MSILFPHDIIGVFISNSAIIGKSMVNYYINRLNKNYELHS